MKPELALVTGLAATLALAGCDSKVPGADVSSKAPSPTKPASSQETKEAPPTPNLDRSLIPAALQTDAYHYYGLGYAKPMDVLITLKPTGGDYTGSVTVKLTKVDKDSATFVAERTGSLSDLIGSDTVILKPDGIYNAGSEKEKIDSPQLELPTSFLDAKPWKVDSLATVDGQEVKQMMTFAYKGAKSVKIGATTYPAALVKGVGTFDEAGTISHVEVSEWLVKDIGNVKMVMVRTVKGQKPVTFTVIWQPTDSKAKS